MIIQQTEIADAYIIKREPHSDERGSFSRVLCKQELEDAGLCSDIVQVNLSTNIHKGTLRGLHYQSGDDAEDKFVICISGSVFDVCVDIRKESPTYGKWVGETLSAENGYALYIPKGCAHGYLTLEDNSSVMYFVTQFYQPAVEGGYRYDDPAFNIKWPLNEPYIISNKDMLWDYS